MYVDHINMTCLVCCLLYLPICLYFSTKLMYIVHLYICLCVNVPAHTACNVVYVHLYKLKCTLQLIHVHVYVFLQKLTLLHSVLAYLQHCPIVNCGYIKICPVVLLTVYMGFHALGAGGIGTR